MAIVMVDVTAERLAEPPIYRGSRCETCPHAVAINAHLDPSFRAMVAGRSCSIFEIGVDPQRYRFRMTVDLPPIASESIRVIDERPRNIRPIPIRYPLDIPDQFLTAGPTT